MARVPEVVAAWHRIRTGRTPVRPAPGGSQAAYVLQLLEGRGRARGRARDGRRAHLHADHEFQRLHLRRALAVATLADLHAAWWRRSRRSRPAPRRRNEDVLRHAPGDRRSGEGRGVRASSGWAPRRPVEGRARESEGNACRASATASTAWTDARARVLRGMAKTMAKPRAANGCSRWLSALRRHAGAHRPAVNVDFFSRGRLDALGIPADLCTSIFAIGRVAGWVRAREWSSTRKPLIRPRADYVGVAPRRLG